MVTKDGHRGPLSPVIGSGQKGRGTEIGMAGEQRGISPMGCTVRIERDEVDAELTCAGVHRPGKCP